MPFGQNTTAVLAIIAAIIITTVANNLINAWRSEEATEQRGEQLNKAEQTQQEIQQFEEAHRNQTQTIAKMLALGVERQDELIAKLDQSLNQSSPADVQ